MMAANGTAFDQERKVCLIIPVYNAQNALGHCLNSVLAQTYTNWTAILVDDGSRDSSLEICRNYAAIDSRFQVVAKPNGGVSSARNAGLELAQGDYLAFLDSDDCLAQDALEKQVSQAVRNQSQLVVTNAMILDFHHPQDDRVMLNSNWLKKSPCVLSAEEFRKKRMRLIWFTALLEGPCSKLYDLNLWKQLALRFPEELSLGEDFVTNLKYYAACNSAVFLNECCYYYNKFDGSGSLTEKYRPDLFENKMLLMEKLEEHLGGREKLSAYELDAFYCYVASSGLGSVENVILTSGLKNAQLLTRVQEMFAHPLFAESIRRATYIPERFAACIESARTNDLAKVIRYIAKSAKNGSAKDPSSAAAGSASRSGILNRAIRKTLRTVRPLLKQSPAGERMTRLENRIKQLGLKNTLVQFVSSRHSSSPRLPDDASDAGETSKHNVLEKRRPAIEQIEQNINEYTWLSEQRMTRDTYLRDINELRQRKKVIMLATAEHDNIGDAAITLAEQNILSKQFPEYFQVEISTYEFKQKEAYLHAILNPEDILVINGGGNIGDLYPEEEELHRKIVAEFPENKIIVFPQTISFIDKKGSELEKSAAVYNAHPDLTLFVRGETSLAFAKEHFGNVKTFLMPDAVHTLKSSYKLNRSGVLLCLRSDGEGQLNAEAKSRIAQTASMLNLTMDSSTNIHSADIPRDIRGLIVRKELMRFASRQLVITDRLHGMIFSAVTGTPCVVLASYNHKIQEYYDAFLRDSNAVFFIGDDMDKLDDTIKAAMQVTDAQYPVIASQSLEQIRAISMEQSKRG